MNFGWMNRSDTLVSPFYTVSLACSTSGWCTHNGVTNSLIDCDKDGRLDPVCTDHSGHFGFISSANSCSRHWPNAVCNSKEGRGKGDFRDF